MCQRCMSSSVALGSTSAQVAMDVESGSCKIMRMEGHDTQAAVEQSANKISEFNKNTMLATTAASTSTIADTGCAILTSICVEELEAAVEQSTDKINEYDENTMLATKAASSQQLLTQGRPMLTSIVVEELEVHFDLMSIFVPRKKLLVLDLNGLLADIRPQRAITKRPFYDDFLDFCFHNFEIGVWSSRKKCNVDKAVEIIFGELKHKLAFCWDMSHCTPTGFNTIERRGKPLVLKQLKKLWDAESSTLPWKKGYFSPSNTLLIDDSPYKALCNPPHTGIFPHSYDRNDSTDNALGAGGDLRGYLEGLAKATDVESYVQEHKFGQPPISEENPMWSFYLEVLDKVRQAM